MHSLKKLAVVASLTLAFTGLTASLAVADAPNAPTANGAAWNSPGILSGNVVQLPIAIPVNVCGNNVGLLGALLSTSGTACTNG